MKIVVTGANGQVGWELTRSLMPLGDVVALGKDEANFEDPASLFKSVQGLNPDVIVNAAAYTQVDKAEEEQLLVYKINEESVGVLAEIAKNNNALLVHYSTDYVFNGEKQGLYTEVDKTAPLNIYGKSKLAGEKIIQKINCDYLIFRTTWVYSARGSNFLRTVLRLVGEHEQLKMIDDQYGAPTWSRNLADATAQVVARCIEKRKLSDFRSSIYNIASSGVTTWYGFSREILNFIRNNKYDLPIKVKNITPIATGDYPLPAARPKNSCLDMSAIVHDFSIKMPDWRRSLELCLKDMMSK